MTISLGLLVRTTASSGTDFLTEFLWCKDKIRQNDNGPAKLSRPVHPQQCLQPSKRSKVVEELRDLKEKLSNMEGLLKEAEKKTTFAKEKTNQDHSEGKDLGEEG